MLNLAIYGGFALSVATLVVSIIVVNKLKLMNTTLVDQHTRLINIQNKVNTLK